MVINFHINLLYHVLNQTTLDCIRVKTYKGMRVCRRRTGENGSNVINSYLQVAWKDSVYFAELTLQSNLSAVIFLTFADGNNQLFEELFYSVLSWMGEDAGFHCMVWTVHHLFILDTEDNCPFKCFDQSVSTIMYKFQLETGDSTDKDHIFTSLSYDFW